MAAVAIALGGLAFAVYMATGRTAWVGDTLPARYLPVAVLERGTLYLDQAPFLLTTAMPRGPDGETPYALRRVAGHYVSAYPVGTALLAVPVYLVARVAGADLDDDRGLERLEKIAASVLVATSVVLLTLALLAMTESPGWAVTIAALYAFGTSSLSASSQALWQHAGSQLLLCIVILALARDATESGRTLFLVGFASGAAFVTRPSDAIILLPVLCVLAWRKPAAAWRLVVGAAPPVLFELGYRWTYFANPFYTQAADLRPGVWHGRWIAGFVGLLASPGRGLFVYSPMFMLSVLGFARRGVPTWVRALGVGCLLTVVVYARWAPWWGGYSVGPRILADVAPVLALGLVPLRERPWRAAVAFTGILAIAAHALCAFTTSPTAWNGWVDVDRAPERLWSVRRSPLACAVREVVHGVAAASDACHWPA